MCDFLIKHDYILLVWVWAGLTWIDLQKNKAVKRKQKAAEMRLSMDARETYRSRDIVRDNWFLVKFGRRGFLL